MNFESWEFEKGKTGSRLKEAGANHTVNGRRN
jgi:hypothetical protein